MINQQLKLISVTSSAYCTILTDMSVQNQQHIYNMESEIAKLKQQNATLVAQQKQLQLQQQQLQLKQQRLQVVTSVKKHRHHVKKN